MTEPDGTRHENQSVHRGTLRAAAEGPEIVYEQVDEGVRARISLTRTADGVQMRRMGEMTGALHFQPGRKTPGLYGTAYGDIPVAVYTREVLVEESEKGGEMRLDYDVFVGGERTAATVMTLTWRLYMRFAQRPETRFSRRAGAALSAFCPTEKRRCWSAMRQGDAKTRPRCSAHAAQRDSGPRSGTVCCCSRRRRKRCGA